MEFLLVSFVIARTPPTEPDRTAAGAAAAPRRAAGLIRVLDRKTARLQTGPKDKRVR